MFSQIHRPQTAAAERSRMLMMKERHSWISVALLFALSSVTAVKKLQSIEDLKEIDFGQSVPAHSLVLLHWFANTIIIDRNNRIRLTFDPYNGDYGARHFGNYGMLLGPLPQGHQYYSVGRLHQETSVQLPEHVVDPPDWLDGGNRDRIIFRVCGERIDQVYITQHYDDSDSQGTLYDPDHTFQITTNLLREITEFPLRGNFRTLRDLRYQYEANVNVSTVKKSWGHLACLGLFLCIVMDKMVYNEEQSIKPVRRQRQELTQNRGSGRNDNSESWTKNLCMYLVLFLIVILFVCASQIHKM